MSCPKDGPEVGLSGIEVVVGRSLDAFPLVAAAAAVADIGCTEAGGLDNSPLAGPRAPCSLAGW